MKTILLCCTLLLFAFGCKKNNNSDNGNTINTYATDIFPNKVGDTWLYLVNDTTVNLFSHDSSAIQYSMSISITDSVQLPEGIKANVWVYNFSGNTDTNYVFQKGDTIRFMDKTNTYIARQYIIPLKLHNSWEYVQGIYDVTVDSQANIIIGQNHFDDAFNLDGYQGLPDAIFYIDEWVVNNVGVVKRYFNPSGELINIRHVIGWSLLSFHLK